MTWWRRPYLWAAVSALAVIVSNLGGLAVGDDGIGYQAVADSLTTGDGLGYFLEPRLTIWPPGWPTLMAVVARVTTLDTEQAAVVLNAIVAFAVVMFTHRLLLRTVRDQQFVLAGTVVAAIGCGPMIFGHLLMTDMAFVAVTLALFLALLNIRRGDDFGWFIISVQLVAAAFLLRYAGVVLIATACVWFLTDRRMTLMYRLRLCIVFGALSSAIPALWILRNRATDGTNFGVRYSSARGLVHNIYDTIAAVGNFLVPGVEIERRPIWVLVALIGCSVVGAMLWRVLSANRNLWNLAGITDLAGSATGLLSIHIVLYTLYMLYARTTTGLNQLDFRLLNPLYLPLVIVGLAIMDRVCRLERPLVGPEAGVFEEVDGVEQPRKVAPTLRSGGTAPTAWQRAARTSVFSWATLNVALGVGLVAWFATSPDVFVGNYERDAFDQARRSDALDALPARCQVSSNLPNALYEAGIEAQWSPRNTGLESNDPVDDLDRLEASLARRDHCLVWIDLEPRYGHLATLDELRERFELVELGSDDGVTTYQFRPRTP